MSFCTNCGKELPEGAAFCSSCGTPVAASAATSATAPVDVAEKRTDEEKKFLDLTHQFLRWEQKAWKIFGTVVLIVGICFAAFFSLFMTIGLIVGDEGYVIGGIGFLYAILFGGIYIPLGIINLAAAKKIPQYLDSLHTDFRPTFNRCGSVGMLIFTIFFNNIAFVFFLINFIRMQTNREVIEKILAR